MIEFEYAIDQILIGAVLALILHALIRVRAVACVIAALLALGVIYAVVAADGLSDMKTLFVERLSELARSGMLLGLTMATTVASFLSTLVRSALKPAKPHAKKRSRKSKQGATHV